MSFDSHKRFVEDTRKQRSRILDDRLKIKLEQDLALVAPYIKLITPVMSDIANKGAALASVEIERVVNEVEVYKDVIQKMIEVENILKTQICVNFNITQEVIDKERIFTLNYRF
jgi:hypothetical protein